jgi:hypothetical protein
MHYLEKVRGEWLGTARDILLSDDDNTVDSNELELPIDGK